MHQWWAGFLKKCKTSCCLKYQVLSPQLCWLLTRIGFQQIQNSFTVESWWGQLWHAHRAGTNLFLQQACQCIQQVPLEFDQWSVFHRIIHKARGTACTSCGKLVWPVTKLRWRSCQVLVICRGHLNSGGFGLQAKNRIMILLLRHFWLCFFKSQNVSKSTRTEKRLYLIIVYLTGLVNLSTFATSYGANGQNTSLLIDHACPGIEWSNPEHDSRFAGLYKCSKVFKSNCKRKWKMTGFFMVFRS